MIYHLPLISRDGKRGLESSYVRSPVTGNRPGGPVFGPPK